MEIYFQGDLEELLSKVPVYTGPTVPQGTFPQLLNDGNHPYHLIVVSVFSLLVALNYY